MGPGNILLDYRTINVLQVKKSGSAFVMCFFQFLVFQRVLNFFSLMTGEGHDIFHDIFHSQAVCILARNREEFEAFFRKSNSGPLEDIP